MEKKSRRGLKETLRKVKKTHVGVNSKHVHNVTAGAVQENTFR